ncbi:MAG: hypothetical protein HYY06_22465 [Deltaproteobacteria bacterium]|nr:hypothetical protein [Deltaproteobacteria bacterium]
MESRAESLTAEEQELLALINTSRAEAGLQPLGIDANLSAVARAHSLDMSTSGFFAHVSPTTGELTDRLAAGEIRFESAAENIALNLSVEAAHRALMDSPPHRANLLSPDLTTLGVGIVSNGRQLVVTEDFIQPAEGFVATLPSEPSEAVVAEPREEDLVRVLPADDLGARSDPTNDEDDACLHEPITVIPGQRAMTPAISRAPRAYPIFQVRPVPAPMLQPVAPRGIWIVGPNSAWYSIQPAPARPFRRRPIVRSYRYTY